MEWMCSPFLFVSVVLLLEIEGMRGDGNLLATATTILELMQIWRGNFQEAIYVHEPGVPYVPKRTHKLENPSILLVINPRITHRYLPVEVYY